MSRGAIILTIAMATLLLSGGCTRIHRDNVELPAESVSRSYTLMRMKDSGDDDLKAIAFLRTFDAEGKLAICQLYYVAGSTQKEAEFQRVLADVNSYVEVKGQSGATVRITPGRHPAYSLKSDSRVWTANPYQLLMSVDNIPQKPDCVRTTADWSAEFERSVFSIHLVLTTYQRRTVYVPIIIYR